MSVRGAAGGVVSVAAPAPPAPLAVFHFAHVRYKNGVEVILDLPKMTPKQPNVFCWAGEMHAVETGQMSFAETGQMSSGQIGQV